MRRHVFKQTSSHVVVRTDEIISEDTGMLAVVSFGLLPPVARLCLREIFGGLEEDIRTRLLPERWCAAPMLARNHPPYQSCI